MIDKEKLYYLVREYLKGNYLVSTFCNEFIIQYNIETDYSELSDIENQYFGDLSEMTARFSEYEEDLKIPHLYFSESQIKNKVIETANVLHIAY